MMLRVTFMVILLYGNGIEFLPPSALSNLNATAVMDRSFIDSHHWFLEIRSTDLLDQAIGWGRRLQSSEVR
jgi:hypothetical protein